MYEVNGGTEQWETAKQVLEQGEETGGRGTWLTGRDSGMREKDYLS